MSAPRVVVGGEWLDSLTAVGEIEWSTCWPGGTDSISFEVRDVPKQCRPGALVELEWAGERLACGTLIEPKAGERLMAEGLWRLGENYPALTSLGAVTTDPDIAIAQAITLGLPWLNPEPSPFDGAMAMQSESGPLSISQLLDTYTAKFGARWGVDPYRRVVGSVPGPMIHLLPGVEGLGITRDGYASTLYARYLDSATATYKTASATDAVAAARWGAAYAVLPKVLHGGASMTAADAVVILNGALKLGRAKMGWTNPIEVEYGDVVNTYNQPVELPSIVAGQSIRLHGLTQDMEDVAGRTWQDVQLARVEHKADGKVTLTPERLVSPMADVLAAL